MNKDDIKDDDLFIIEVTPPDDAPPILPMDEFLGKVAAVYPELTELSFNILIDKVVEITDSGEIFAEFSQGGNLLEFLYLLANRLPSSTYSE